MIHESLHRFPGVEQCDVVIVKDVTVFIPRILIVAGLKRKWSVNEVEIQILEPESLQTRLESWFDALGPVIGVPQLVVTKMSSRAIGPAASPACNASPTSRSFPYRSAQSKCRNPASSASLVAVIVTAGSGIKVPKPSAGIWPAP
jgi:hypothetical protein